MSAISPYNNAPFSYARTPLEEALRECYSYNSIRNYLLRGEIDRLDPESKTIFLKTIANCRFDEKTLLVEAMLEDDYDLLDKLFSLGFDINEQFNNWAPLIFFVPTKNKTMYAYFINKGANLDALSADRQHLINDLRMRALESFGNSHHDVEAIMTILHYQLSQEWMKKGYLAKEDLIVCPFEAFDLFLSRGCLFTQISKNNIVLGGLLNQVISPTIGGRLLPSEPSNEELKAIFLQLALYGEPNLGNIENILPSQELACRKIYWHALNYLAELFVPSPLEGCSKIETAVIEALFKERDFKRVICYLLFLCNTHSSLSLIRFSKNQSILTRIGNHILEVADAFQVDFWGYVVMLERRRAPITAGVLLKLGISPNYFDSKWGRNALFASRLKHVNFSLLLSSCEIDSSRLDCNGCNPMTFLVEQLSNHRISEDVGSHQCHNLELLYSLGIPTEISDPDLEKLKQYAGDNHIHILLYCLLKNTDATSRVILRDEILEARHSGYFESFIWDVAADCEFAQRILPLFVRFTNCQIKGGRVIKLNYWSELIPTEIERLRAELNFEGTTVDLKKAITDNASVYPLIPYLLRTEAYLRKKEAGVPALNALNETIMEDPIVCERRADPDFIEENELRASILNKHKLEKNSEIRLNVEFFSKYSNSGLDEFLSRKRTARTLRRVLDPIDLNFPLKFPDNPLFSLIFHALFYHFGTSVKKPFLKISQVMKIFQELPPIELRQLIEILWNDLEYMNYFSRHYLRSLSLKIYPRGYHDHSYRKILAQFVSASSDNYTADFDPMIDSAHKKIDVTVMRVLVVSGKLIKRLGRTYLFTDSSSPFWNAYKICKAGENFCDFAKEAAVTAAYKAKGIFQSGLHIPIGVYLVKELSIDDPELEKMKIAGWHYVYHYKAEPAYFDYLHDERLNEDEFNEGRYRFINDTIEQIKLGIYPFIADLYHNESRQRRYLPLADFFRSLFARDMGSGRVDHWIKSILYPNVRRNGIADVGDAHLLSEFISDGIHPFSDIRGYGLETVREGGQCAVFQMIALSRLMLIDMLLLAYRKRQLEVADWRNEDHLQSVADALISGFAVVLHKYTSRELDFCHTFLHHCGVKWKRAVRQLFFWLEPHGDAGYVKWMEQKRVPPKLYSKTVAVEVNVGRAQNYSPHLGFSDDGVYNDIGPFNGPMCMSEMEKAWWIVTSFAISMRNS